MPTHISLQGTVSRWVFKFMLQSWISYWLINLETKKIQTSFIEIYRNKLNSSGPIIHSAIRSIQTWRAL